MPGKFFEIAVTDSVREAQKCYFGRAHNFRTHPERDPLTDEEIRFVRSRDSFYMATVTETGWPYIQHRGGAPGFLR
ncbi:MAG TPA: pyridoxamine 5'-phosphate oxidase family protein, partial [Verrucomicrobiae bacterium]|nr:pyridoxamine 5'-phosphate oxidase family protein [Verrucomicrobiae bacterium]